MNKVVELLGKLTDIVYLSVLWLVFSLPLLTVGASTTALYHSVTKVFLNDKSYITREFLRAFRANFKQSTIVWLIVLFVSIVFVIDFLILFEFAPEDSYSIMLIVLLYLLVMLIMFVNCLFPTIARFQTTIKQVYRNCFIIIMANLPWNILVLLIFAMAVIVVWFFPPTILLAPAVYMICAGKIFEHIFKKYINETK